MPFRPLEKPLTGADEIGETDTHSTEANDARRDIRPERRSGSREIESAVTPMIKPSYRMLVRHPEKGLVWVTAVPRPVKNHDDIVAYTILLINQESGLHEDVPGFINGRAIRPSGRTPRQYSDFRPPKEEEFIQIVDAHGKPLGTQISAVPPISEVKPKKQSLFVILQLRKPGVVETPVKEDRPVLRIVKTGFEPPVPNVVVAEPNFGEAPGPLPSSVGTAPTQPSPGWELTPRDIETMHRGLGVAMRSLGKPPE